MNERRVERVARAMCFELGIDPDGHAAASCYDAIGPSRMPAWWQFFPHAKAAIRALKSCLTPEYDSKKREDLYVELD
jgi:hypothetical protein